MDLLDLISLIPKELVLKDGIDFEKAKKAFEEADSILKQVGFLSKNNSVFGNLLDVIWHQAETEYPKLL